MRRQNKTPRNKREKQAYDRVLHALADMRRGVSISRAARENGVTRRTMERYAGGALMQDRQGGRIRATKNDRLLRYLQIPGPNGTIDITVRGSKEASKAARYKAAVNRFLAGDQNALIPWRGEKVAGVALLTDPDILKNLADKDVLPYSLYRSLSGGGAE
jgi:hypothetical protein